MRNRISFIFTLLSFFTLFGQQIDVVKYDLIIQISDTTDRINVVETMTFLKTASSNKVNFNFISKNEKGLGMKISELTVNGEKLIYSHVNNILSIEFEDNIAATAENTLIIYYSGIPQDGLIIGKNRYGNRTFFGDNWPNRAQHWFACNDHPSDKALIDFSIIAPEHYEVIANGTHKGTVEYSAGFKSHLFSSANPLPTKVIVFGAADFSVQHLPEFERFELSSWVYPENESAGFHDMHMAIDVLNYFEKKISPFPFEKLANVQSTTRYGGMENAGCIFYSERAITGKGMMEELIAHEIAHQWFGNSASEKNWSHLWLSEGFATYLTHLYVLEKYGDKRFQEGLAKDRQTVKHFYNQQILPLVDTISTDPNVMLNANAYQRGAWALHMLRIELGDELFWKGIKNYYATYQYGNANSKEFIQSIEKSTGKDLQIFAKQWLESGVIPDLKIQSKIKGKKANLVITQKQKGLAFLFPLEVEATLNNGSKVIEVIEVSSSITEMVLKMDDKIKCLKFDPNVKLLYLD